MRDLGPGGVLVRRPPVVTYGLLAVNAVLFLLQQGSQRLTDQYALSAYGVQAGRWYEVVTAGFLHANVLHILFNMLLLFQLGTVLEARLGPWRYAGLYAFALLGGSIGELILSRPNVAALGASGAVFGLMGAVVALRGAHRTPFEASVGGLIAINLLITFAIPGIAIGGHIGGLVAGGLAGLLVKAVGERVDLTRALATAARLVAGTILLLLAGMPLADWAVRTGAFPIGFGS
jgi:membrane associated rhomboid family serine protease